MMEWKEYGGLLHSKNKIGFVIKIRFDKHYGYLELFTGVNGWKEMGKMKRAKSDNDAIEFLKGYAEFLDNV